MDITKVRLTVWVAVCAVVSLQPVPVLSSVNGGHNCAACTIIVSIAEQLSEIHNETITDGFARLCSFLPDDYVGPCKVFLDLVTPVIEELILRDLFNPDVACHATGICYTEAGQPECALYPKRKGSISHTIKKVFPDPMVWKIHKQKVRSNLKSDICTLLPGLKQFCEMIEKKLTDHLPVMDEDSDRFSSIETLRGSHFRGRDCDDFQKNFYPGRRPIDGDKLEDSNCNGIYGTDKKTGKTYEELFCSDTKNYGVVILGDSAAAHFHLPREWFSAVEISWKSFEPAPMIIADEIDWPHLSAVTGYTNSSLLPWWTDSVYLKLNELNRCNHRDYQNIGVNGADSGSMNDTIQYSMARSPKNDYPLLVFYSLIGNDVCNGHANTTHDMTLPADMKKRFESTLKYLDTQLPAGSFVIATGLADGRFLYNTLKDKIHPLGDWRKDITYPMVYDFLDCIKSSPCAGWMSHDESIRNFTSERAANLSLAVKEVTETFKATNFKVHYVDYDIEEFSRRWVKRGGKPEDLIEPVDGFHPSQIGNVITGEYFWEHANKFFPGVFSKNPHNADIKKMFGDQGGY